MTAKNPPSVPSVPPTRERLTIDVSADILLVLDHICTTTGMTRNAAALMILANGVVSFVEASMAIKKASETITKLNQAKR